MFFPNGLKGLHDPNRTHQPTEGQFVLHYLRNVRKELLENHLFTFLAAYRLETNRLISCYHALRGFVTNDAKVEGVEGVEKSKLKFVELRGSRDYYQKQYFDLIAKSATFGFPQIFYTFSSCDKWEVTLACSLSQDGTDIWHTEDEKKRLGTLGGNDSMQQELDCQYVAHVPSTHASNCPFHINCKRIPAEEVLTQFEQTKLLCRNLYTVNRIFDQRARSLVKHIICSTNNPMKVKAFHDVKEFGDVSGWAHVHGVGWRQNDVTKAIFAKLHTPGTPITEYEKFDLVELAESIVSVRLSAENISPYFPDLAGPRAEDIAILARKHQTHSCTLKCQRDEFDGCWFHFPRLPSGLTLIAAPPSFTLEKIAANYLVRASSEVKTVVQNCLKELSNERELHTMSLLRIVQRAFGEVEETHDGTGFLWKGNIFPQVDGWGCHSVNRWRLYLAEFYDYPGPDVLNPLSIYYAALSTSCNTDHDLISRRAPSEVWVADYNPYCLEAMRSNMEVKLIMSNPDTVLSYMTKAKSKRTSHARLVDELRENEPDLRAQKVADRADQMREVCQSEAFFRLDRNMHLSDSNVPTVWVNSAFPDLRGATYTRVHNCGIDLPNRPGTYFPTSRMDDKYAKK